MSVNHFYPKMNPLLDANWSRTPLKNTKTCEILFLDVIDLKIERDHFSHNFAS